MPKIVDFQPGRPVETFLYHQKPPHPSASVGTSLISQPSTGGNANRSMAETQKKRSRWSALVRAFGGNKNSAKQGEGTKSSEIMMESRSDRGSGYFRRTLLAKVVGMGIRNKRARRPDDGSENGFDIGYQGADKNGKEKTCLWVSPPFEHDLAHNSAGVNVSFVAPSSGESEQSKPLQSEARKQTYVYLLNGEKHSVTRTPQEAAENNTAGFNIGARTPLTPSKPTR